jgi:hypothetical protein
MLELTLQWALKPMQVYMVNKESEWITDQVHIEAIILEDSQKLTFDVLNSIKYDVILECPDYAKELKNWLNQQRIYIMIDVYEILNNQKWAYQSISHEIIKYRYWMTSSQSECHYTQWAKINSRKSELTLTRISKEDSSDHQSHWQNTQFCLYQRRMTQSNYVSTTDNSTR